MLLGALEGVKSISICSNNMLLLLQPGIHENRNMKKINNTIQHGNAGLQEKLGVRGGAVTLQVGWSQIPKPCCYVSVKGLYLSWL